MKHAYVLGAFLGVSLLSTGSANAANLLVNGDFEAASAHGGIPSGWTDSAAVASGPFGALNVGVYIGQDYNGCCGTVGSPAAYANRFTGFGVGDSDNAGGVLAQSFGTLAGRTYTATFDLAALGQIGSPQTFVVTLTDVASNATLISQSYTVLGAGNLDTAFSGYSLNFAAAGAATRLSFVDASQTFSIDGVVDNVSVSGVPEPSTWAMLLAGFAGLVMMARRSARRSLAAG